MKNSLIILLVFPVVIWSQSYVGHIDKYPIHLKLERYANDEDKTKGEFQGFYFYDSKLISIPLRGIFDNEHITLVDGYHYFEDEVDSANELFKLKKKGSQLVGSLKLKQKRYNVVLAKTEDDILENFRNPQLTFVKDSVVTYKDKQLVWFHEKWSKAPLFRLGNGFTKDQRAVFNPILDEVHMEDAKGMLDCNSWFELSFEINLVNDNFISFTKYYSVYCGGAHPSHGNVDYNFDLNTLNNVDRIETLYPNVDFFERLKTKYYNEEEEIQEEDCEVFVDENYWDYKTWNLTPEGVILTPSYPHAMTACEEPYFLSYKELKQE